MTERARNPLVQSLSACFPCYNDADTIGSMVDGVHAALAPIVDDLEVVVANDGSQDGSAAVLDEMATTRPWLRVVHHEANRGYGGALRSAFGEASKEWVFYTDGDAQYDASEAADLVQLVTADVDVVQGWKIERGDAWYRKVVGRVYHHVVKRLFNLHLRDTDCDFRLIRRELLERTRLRSTSGVICVEMMRKLERAGARFVEAPVHHFHRPSGRSQFFRLPAIARTARELLRLWWDLIVRARPDQ
ncbi:MAG: glycosyltransferase family 2 protein [Acidimicrobiales bacterium]